MAEPSREQALQGVADALAGMTGVRPWGGGWSYRNPPRVSRTFRTLPQVNEFPYFIVMEGPNSKLLLDEERSLGATATAYTHILSVLVIGYVSGDPEISRSTWVQRAWDDSFRTLLKSNTLGGVVRTIEPGEEFETDQGESEPKGGFVQEFLVWIDESVEVV